MATQLGSIKRVRRFPGFVVDGFNYQSPDVVAYFLTHFHADHTCGLHAGFKGPAPIYCTAITAALVTDIMGVKPSLVRAVRLNDETAVETADGRTAFVTFLDANHCPGSATIHFRKADEVSGESVVAFHTGDFRAARCVREDPNLHALLEKHGPIGELYLDTTYCDPRWGFPDQKIACSAMAELARLELLREPGTLFLVGSYSIGKEKAIASVARAVRSKVGVGWHRARTLKLTGWWDDSLFKREDFESAASEATDSGDPNVARGGGEAGRLPSGSSGGVPEPPCRVRVSSMGGGAPHARMACLLRESVDSKTGAPFFKAVVSFKPTGWSFSKRRDAPEGFANVAASTARGSFGTAAFGETAETNGAKPETCAVEEEERAFVEMGVKLAAKYEPWIENDGTTRLYSVPYSEHSSFDELLRFVEAAKPAKITPTVNASTERERAKILRHFQHLTNAREDRNRLEHYFLDRGVRGEKRASETLEDDRTGAGAGAAEVFEPAKSNGKPLFLKKESALSAQANRTEFGSGIDPETLAALEGMGAPPSPSELAQQVALFEEAARWKAQESRVRMTKTREDPSSTPFPLACVAMVRGGGGGFGGRGPRYAQFRDKAHIEQRLRALGAVIAHRVSPKVTHVIVPSGGEALAEERRRWGVSAASGPAGLSADDPDDKSAQRRVGVEIVTEGWVMRHWRAFQNGAAKAHAPLVAAARREEVAEEKRREANFKRNEKRRKKEALENGEDVRRGPQRTMGRVVLDRVARALAQRLFLIRRVDVRRGSVRPGDPLAPSAVGGDDSKWRAKFVVFGAAGNVYECDVCEFPQCDCPEFVGGRRGGVGFPGSRVCRHLLWVYVRVLGVSRDDPLLCQTALTKGELARILADPTAAHRATVAAASARRADAARTGDGSLGDEQKAPAYIARMEIPRKAAVPAAAVKRENALENSIEQCIGEKEEEEETCPVCFEPVVDRAELAAVGARLSWRAFLEKNVWWCRLGCGSNVHAACMRRWIEKNASLASEGSSSASCPLCRAEWISQEHPRDSFDEVAKDRGGVKVEGGSVL